MRHIISILVENKFGALARIAGMFSGRGFNIETLNVGPMVDQKFSRITATILGDSDSLEQAIRQVEKLINVIEVTQYSSEQATERELHYATHSGGCFGALRNHANLRHISSQDYRCLTKFTQYRNDR